MARPSIGDYASFYQAYIAKTEGCDSVTALIERYSNEINAFIISIPDEKAHYAYAENKWTVNDLLQHMIDAERIFTYRALTFARKDDKNLPGFDENEYAATANANGRTLQSLKEEFTAVRKSTDTFFVSLTEEQLQTQGKANNNPVTVNAIAFITFGHVLHHIQILKERYL